MYLRNLYIKNHKLLKDFRIDFNQPLSVLIGKNGSGKSTVLEALAWILRGAYLHFVEDKKDVNPRFEFELQYVIRLTGVNYERRTEGVMEINYINMTLKGTPSSRTKWRLEADNTVYTKEELIEKYGINKLLPDNIIVYYAGWFETMQNICQPFEDDYKLRLRAKATSTHEVYSRLEAQPMFYIQQYHFPMLLAALFSYEYNDAIDAFFYDKIGINNKSFVLTFFIKKPNWQRNNDPKTFWGAEGLLLQFLQLLKENNVFKEDEYDSKRDEFNFALEPREWYAIKEVFGEEKKLFYLMNMLHASDMLGELRVATNKIDGRTALQHWSLSEGEQQLITIKAISELLIEDNTLLLFDEPDTYMHPIWQREFLKNVEETIEGQDAHMIVTSHSPFIAASAKKSQLYVLNNEEGKAQLKTVSFNSYGQPADRILIDYFGLDGTRPKHIDDKIKDLQDRVMQNAYDTEGFKLDYKALADEIGKTDNDLMLINLEILKRRKKP